MNIKRLTSVAAGVPMLTLERLWKDGEVWKSSRSFSLGDTADIELVLTQAREWVAAQTKSEPVAA